MCMKTLLVYSCEDKEHLQIVKCVKYLLTPYTGCSAKMYPIFVLFISPVKIEIFQVRLFHIIGNFVFSSKICFS